MKTNRFETSGAAMGPRAFLLALSFFSIALSGCDLFLLGSPGGGGAASIEARNFYAYNWVTKADYTVHATPLAVSTYCAVYADDDETVTASTAQAIADEFDQAIYPLMKTDYGSWNDVDGNGRVIILLIDILDGYSGSGGYYAGYFNPTDMYSDTVYSDSNEADMLTMDINPGVPGSTSFYSTISHEMQHLINYSVNKINKGINADTWLNEGLSTSAEYMYAGTDVNGRVSYYNNYGSLSISSGNNFYYWDSDAETDLLANYSTAYMFFQWLRIHATNGAGIYKKILYAGKGDYRDVTSVAELWIDSQFSSWPTLMTAWYAANLCNDSTGYYGYEGALGTLTKQLYSGSTSVSLHSGEGVLMSISSAFTPGSTGSDIAYAGITENSGATASVLDTASPYAGGYVLALNGNLSSSVATTQSASIPASVVSASALLASVQATDTVMPTYPMDPVFDVK